MNSFACDNLAGYLQSWRIDGEWSESIDKLNLSPVELQPNETKVVSFTINEKTIEFFTANKIFEAEAGDFKVFIGGSSDNTIETKFEYLK